MKPSDEPETSTEADPAPTAPPAPPPPADGTEALSGGNGPGPKKPNG